MLPAHLIARKRDGLVHRADEIRAVVAGAVTGAWADYQLSAWLMAVCCRGLDADETATLTEAMMRSGTVVRLDAIAAPKVDKHSTGGVGDKVSLVLAPMVAACGVVVPMVSGRGLGHTGGTLDKLESIPGFRVNLTLDEYRAQLARLGVALIGATAEIAPADRRLYALRDVTGTVESIPLICASILAKKLAEGIDALVLDVKFGEGAFMPDRARARELARALVAVATRLGKPTRAVLTAMDEPLGHTVGNALEVAEAVACLRGSGPADVMEVTLTLGAHMLLLAGRAPDADRAREQLQAGLASGAALEKWRQIVRAQGGDERTVDDPGRLPAAPVVRAVRAGRSGIVTRVAARPLALAALRLGAGRARAEEKILPAVGLAGLVKTGQPVRAGDTLALIHAATEEAAGEAAAAVAGAIALGDAPVAPGPLIAEVIG